MFINSILLYSSMSSVRERLEKLKNQPRRVEPALRPNEIAPSAEKVLLSPESVFMRKVEKLMKGIDELKKKMHSDTGQYLSLYYDLKKAEQDFIEAVEDADMDYLDVPRVFLQKIEQYKSKIKR
jgi:hypothetical protein